jgi:NAD(P)-dependent dehydrogenase (short-subunit alcohol dehydrogenase family)
MGVLDGRRAIVTGGAWGIGRAISRTMAAAGAQVMIADVNDARGAEAVELIKTAGGDASYLRCDVSDAAQVEKTVAQTVAQFGGLDILVNNAGIPGEGSPAHEVDLDLWDRMIAVNLRGQFVCAKYALPHLMASGRGAMVNIASTFGVVGAPGTPGYAASKGGVIALTKQLAVDYGPRGVRVNAICPGYIDNDMNDRRTRMTPEDAAANLAAREAAAALQPLGRQGQTDEIGRVATFLASDDASFMTGAIVPVDGGCLVTFNLGHRSM